MKNGYQQLIKILFIPLAIAWSFQAVAQERTVSGRVTSSDDGEGLPGVNILIKGTATGSVTDFDGNYKVTVSGDEAVLVFSFIGYATQEITVGSQSTIDVLLAADITALDEVVVIGYGTQTKKEVTSAVTSVKEEDFNQGNVFDPAQLLQGKAPGLSIIKTNGGDPNSGYTIRIRGLATIGSNVEPLIIIDGALSTSLDQVDPSDILSMDVLKDGAAAAIYGTRGSNGVIIVTTKRGSGSRAATFDYNGYIAFENVAKTVPVLDAAGYKEHNPSGDKGSTTDWFDLITETGISQTHNLAMAGTSGSTSYRVSFNYRDIGGVQVGTSSKRINSRINIKQTAINEKLTIRATLALTDRKMNFGFNDVFRYATVYNPTEPVRVTADDNTSGLAPADFTRWDGYYQNVQFDYYNPVAINEQNINEGTSTRVDYYIQGEYEFVEGLIGNISYSQQRLSKLNGKYWDKNSFWVGADRNGLAERNSSSNFTEILETTGHYTHDFNGLNFKALVGYSWQELTNEGFNASGGDFVTDKFSYNNLGGALDFNNGLGSISSFKNKTTLIAYFTRLNFNWNDTYYLMASYRYEGSSMFGANNKWAGFPAVSGGVVLSNLMSMSALDNLKFRASYGETGTLPASPYLSIARLGPTGNAFINGAFAPAFGPVSNENPNLKWETKREWDIGLDFALLDYKLTGTFDIYGRTTSDALFLFDVPVPPNLFGQTWLNIGEIKNNGVELGLSYLLVDNANTTYTTGINFSTYKTELVSLSSEEENLQFGDKRIINDLGSPGQNGTLITLVKEGEEIGNIWGPVMGDPVVDENGDWNIVDTNGDGVVNRDDEQIIGNGLPDWELGWTNVFSFGSWDLNIFFRGAFGHDLLNTYRAFYENPNLIGTYNVLESSFDGQLDGLVGGVNKYGSFQVENASYFKLDNMSIGYNFDLADGAAFHKIRLYATGQNLFIITDYTGVDPEVRYFDDVDNAGVLGAGIDRRNTWFRTRTIAVGIQLGF